MANGLNTETEDSLLRVGQYPEFTQMTTRGGKLAPRPGDLAYTPAAGEEAWLLARVGEYDIAKVYDADSKTELTAFCPVSGGVPKFTADYISESNIVWPMPGMPEYGFTQLTYELSPPPDGGLPTGDTRKYAGAWIVNGIEYGLGDVIAVTNDARTLFLSTITGVDPPLGATLTNSTQGTTAKYRGKHYNPTGVLVFYIIKESEKSSATTWADGDVITWTGGTGTMQSAESALGGGFDRMHVVLEFATKPSGISSFSAYGLEETTGYWRKVGETTVLNPTQAIDTGFFPYADADLTVLYPLWPGPLDAQGLPVTLFADAAYTAQALVEHKGCLFMASGNKIRVSEPEQPGYFRDNVELLAGGDVLKMVSSGDVVQVFTATGIRYIAGYPGNFEVVKVDSTDGEGAVARGSIVKTTIGTFALFDDGLYLCSGATRKNISIGSVTPSLPSAANRATAIAGASQGIYYLADVGGFSLAYDWEVDEWFVHYFTAKPRGFLWSPTAQALIARINSAHVAIEKGVTPVSWAVRFPKVGDGILRRLPQKVRVECLGRMRLQFLLDGVGVSGYPLNGPGGWCPLPNDRAGYWAVQLAGTGTPSTNAVFSMTMRGNE